MLPPLTVIMVVVMAAIVVMIMIVIVTVVMVVAATVIVVMIVGMRFLVDVEFHLLVPGFDGPVDLAERHLLFAGDSGQRLEFWCENRRFAFPPAKLAFDRPPVRFDRDRFPQPL